MAILLGILSADVPGSIRPVAAMPTTRLLARCERIVEEKTLGDCGYLLDRVPLSNAMLWKPAPNGFAA